MEEESTEDSEQFEVIDKPPAVLTTSAIAKQGFKLVSSFLLDNQCEKNVKITWISAARLYRSVLARRENGVVCDIHTVPTVVDACDDQPLLQFCPHPDTITTSMSVHVAGVCLDTHRLIIAFGNCGRWHNS